MLPVEGWEKFYLIGKGSREKLERNTQQLKWKTNIRPGKEFPKIGRAISKSVSKVISTLSIVLLVKISWLEAISDLETRTLSRSSQADNRWSDTIKGPWNAKELEIYNTLHPQPIELPSSNSKSNQEILRTCYGYGRCWDCRSKQSVDKKISFDCQIFKQRKGNGAEIGSATHELMQRMCLSQRPTLASHNETLKPFRPAVRDKINLAKFLHSLHSSEILLIPTISTAKQPSPYSKNDQKSQEDFVVRGILDGYLLYEDRIILFDYKTDHIWWTESTHRPLSWSLALRRGFISSLFDWKIEKCLDLLQ